MKGFIQFLMTTLLALSLIGCAAQTTTDPAVGKSDYHKFTAWMEKTGQELDDDQAFDNELAKQPEPQTPKEAEALLAKLLDKRIDTIANSANALELRHVDVIKLRNLSIELMRMSKYMLMATYIPTEQNIDKANAVTPRFKQIEAQTEQLAGQLNRTFGDK